VIDARVRRAVAGDASALARMRLDFKREDNEGAPTPASEATFVDAAGPWLRERLENGSWLAWVAEVDGQICGQVFLHAVEKVPDPYPGSAMLGYVTNFYVTRAHRGHGLGRLLLDALRTHTRTENFDTLVVWPSERSASINKRSGFALPQELLELPLSALG
jgi:GNAT superfamily N-acetyltransferase